MGADMAPEDVPSSSAVSGCAAANCANAGHARVERGKTHAKRGKNRIERAKDVSSCGAVSASEKKIRRSAIFVKLPPTRDDE